MKQFKRGKPLLMTAYALLASVGAIAQSPEDPKAIPAFRSAAIRSMLDRVQQKHYQPRALNDTFSINVWKRYIHTLDPNSDVFLQEDIKLLEQYRTQIDDQLLKADPAFFEAILQIYAKRIAEVEADYNALIAQPFTFSKKETVKHIRKEEPFSATKGERKELWRKLLTWHVLKNYMDIAVAADSNALAKGFSTETEVKARGKVKKYFDEAFRVLRTQRGVAEKFDLYLNAVALEFDAHTGFSGPQDRALTEMLNKRYFGLGIELEIKDGEFYVKRLLPGGPAYMSGLIKESDHILSIGDEKGRLQPVSGISNSAVVNMIRGEKGSTVKMELQQPGEQARTVTVKREEIVDTENKAKSVVIEKDGKKFGLIRLNDFYIDATGKKGGAANDVFRELSRLRQEEVEGLIIDLRGNPGGSLDEVVRMCGYFIPKSAISWLKGRTVLNRYGVNNEEVMYTGPLTVMVDEHSASASEIFAAAIQDYRRGLIIGTATTFGKGTAQQMQNLGKMGDTAKGIQNVRYGTLRLTMDKFYRASGASTQLKGVSSDIVLQTAMYTQSVMEKDYPSVMPYDSVAVPAITPAIPIIEYETVIRKAKARIANSPVFTSVEAASHRLREQLAKPAALDLDTYKEQHRQWYGEVKKIQSLRELPAGQRLQVVLSTDREINPAFRNDAEREKVNKDWLERISKDVYIAETVTILEDMIANPAPATKATINKQ
ncbi:carboxy terminal-processing peptidase [Chitinophaga deserti]|uniref:carboxy terminal-processing peptidase n=1 Tax=Chitinophaga deserti TaxID=2164099 RepID=UPI000D6B4B3C|nr:carboxy terminal-processing peptidase [Chitinophaga deserti]